MNAFVSQWNIGFRLKKYVFQPEFMLDVYCVWPIAFKIRKNAKVYCRNLDSRMAKMKETSLVLIKVIKTEWLQHQLRDRD